MKKITGTPVSLLFTALIVACCARTAFSQEHLYSIPAFAWQERFIPASSNAVVEPLSNDTLTTLQKPRQRNPGEIILRRRFESDVYALYLGKRTKDSYNTLSVFKPPQPFGIDNFIGRKLYLQQTDNPNMDIANVYFDNECIYVENAAKIFFFEDGWNKIPMTEPGTRALNVLSYPESATVIIDGIERGRTPLHLSAMASAYIIVKVRKEGYYCTESFVNLHSEQETTRNFVLQEMIPSTEGSYCDPNAMTAENPEGLAELEEQIETLKKSLDQQKEKSRDALERFETEFPEFLPQGEFEKTGDFLQRKELYLQKKNSGKIAIMAKSSPRVYRIEEDLLKLTRYRSEIENRLYFRFLPANLIRISRYEPDLEFFPVDMRVNESGHNFIFSGVLQMPLATAPLFKQEIDKAVLKLAYRNTIFKQDVQQIRPKILYGYVKMSLLFKGGEYTLEGKCSFPGRNEQPESVVFTPTDSLKKGEKE